MHWLIFRAGFLPAIRRYPAAVLLAALAVGLRLLLVPAIGGTSPYLTARLTVAAIAMVLGLAAGILAAITSVLLVEAFLVGGGLILSADVLARAGVMLAEGALFGWAGQAIRNAYSRQLQADRRKDEFLAILSHELRNPLAPMRNCLYLLERDQTLPESARRPLAILDRQTIQLSRLINDLLDVSRITRGRVVLDCSVQDLTAITRDAFEDLRTIVVGKGITPELRTPNSPVWVNGDRQRLVQIITNLVNNAANFTPAGGHIRATLQANQHAILDVTDDGVGIDPSTKDVLFEPFGPSRVPTDRATPGLGLGLALAKGLVDLHGGTIEGFSEGAGKGARFMVTLPLAAAPETGEVRFPLRQPAATLHRRILLIEDNPDTADSLRELLSLDGHEIEVARSGPEGLEKAGRFTPEIVLCDIGLPGMDGYEVAEHLRADPRQRSALLVALTGYALPEDRAHASRAGFTRFIAKPANPEELSTIVREYSLVQAST